MDVGVVALPVQADIVGREERVVAAEYGAVQGVNGQGKVKVVGRVGREAVVAGDGVGVCRGLDKSYVTADGSGRGVVPWSDGRDNGLCEVVAALELGLYNEWVHTRQQSSKAKS